MGKIIEVTELVITKDFNDSISGYQIVECEGVKYRLHCSVSNSSFVGFNHDLCVKIFNKEKGFINLFDNKDIGFKESEFNTPRIDKKEVLKSCFTEFKKHIELLN